MSTTVTSVATVDAAKHLTSLTPQPDALDPDAEMLARVERGVDPQAVNQAFDAIEAVITHSPNPELSRQGLHGFVDMIADRAPDPVAAFKAFTTQHDIQVVEWDTSTLAEDLRGKFYAHYLQLKDGRRILVVPAGQDPAFRLHAVRALLTHQGVTK
ncbi:hypothetical protein [Streptomyces montanisoli]|uniref:Uncharacterized protein n=1 Tax=Streptomyces montanisoli TaxID=2798581 RepID=A0A940RT55_9ACTN|nr:hypothetical protein [Streptomyces montanisoli]MBP0456487.1 hypothetical protein [Streptomyces montanisoli]